jgi:hypothetical protein
MFNNNSHGAGYMIQRDGQGSITIQKGFADVKSFLNAINKLNVSVNDVFVMHFRIATSGGVNKEMCHPFVIHQDAKIVNVTSVTTDLPCFAHNGVIRDLNGVSKEFSDTSLFSQEYLSCEHIISNVYESKAMQEMIEKFVDDSRLCFLHPEKGLLMLGEWHESEGVYYSNGGFKPYKPKKKLGFDYGWDDWGWGSSYSPSKPKKSTSKSKVEKQAEEIDRLAEQYSGQTLFDDEPPKMKEDDLDIYGMTMDNTKKEIMTAYQRILQANPPKGSTKQQMLNHLEWYFNLKAEELEDEEMYNNYIDDDEPSANSISECQCESCLECSQTVIVHSGGKKYNLCGSCYQYVRDNELF